MKMFKKIDLWISIILIILFSLIILIRQDLSYLLIGYSIVGGWQVISMMIHLVNHWFTNKGSNRIVYCCIVAGILIAALLASIINIILYPFLLLFFFAAPFLAIYYTWLCYYELNVKMKRPIFLLK